MVILISIIIGLFTFTTINLAYGNFQDNLLKQEKNSKENIEEKDINELKEESIENKMRNIENIGENTWKIEIPKLELIAPISQGTTQDVMLKYVGHFENTNFWDGNIGLAAHNRGYPINYFEKIKDLNLDDEIIYKTPYGEKIYRVTMYKVIDQTDWSYLEQTEDNRITLITCVKNRPEKRLCVQAIEKI